MNQKKEQIVCVMDNHVFKDIERFRSMLTDAILKNKYLTENNATFIRIDFNRKNEPGFGLVTEEYADGSKIQQKYFFDDNGNLDSYVKARFLKGEASPDDNFKDKQNQLFEFDDRGNLVVFRDLEAEKSSYYEYNKKNQITYAEEVSKFTDTLKKEWAYDQDGNIVSYKDSSGYSYTVNLDGTRNEKNPSITKKVKNSVDNFLSAVVNYGDNAAMFPNKRDLERSAKGVPNYKQVKP